MPQNLAFSLCVQTILLHSQIVLFCGLGTRKNATEWASPPPKGGFFLYLFHVLEHSKHFLFFLVWGHLRAPNLNFGVIS